MKEKRRNERAAVSGAIIIFKKGGGKGEETSLREQSAPLWVPSNLVPPNPISEAQTRQVLGDASIRRKSLKFSLSRLPENFQTK